MSSREEFERLMNDWHLTPEGHAAQIAWLAWQAATERAAKVCEREANYHRADGRIQERIIANRLAQAIREGNE